MKRIFLILLVIALISSTIIVALIINIEEKHVSLTENNTLFFVEIPNINDEKTTELKRKRKPENVKLCKIDLVENGQVIKCVTTTEHKTTTGKHITTETTTAPVNSSGITPKQFKTRGVVYYNNWKFTWYSERVLPGRGLNIPGRWSDTYFVKDGNGYICCACVDRPRGTVVSTPWGNAKVYDTGCPSGIIDIYVTW